MVGPESESSTPTWECLEALVREKAQEMVQRILEEEVTELLGREKSERKRAVDAPDGYRNGYGKPRRLAMSSGTITVRRPRVRGLEERIVELKDRLRSARPGTAIDGFTTWRSSRLPGGGS